MDNLEKILQIPAVIDAKRVKLSSELLDTYGANKDVARRNSRNIFVYKIVYKSHGKRIAGYLAEPREGAELPCIIWNRGGSRDYGKLEDSSFFSSRLLPSRLAQAGYIVVCTQYPGVDGGEGIDTMGGEDDINSVLDLRKVLQGYKQADSSRIGMGGISNGGARTYQCLARAKWIKAAVCGAAPDDEVSGAKFRKDWREHQVYMFGGKRKDQIARSPIYWVDKLSKKTPVLIMHGTADRRVNPQGSLRMSQEMQRLRIPYRLIMYEGADHGFTEFRKDMICQTINWFDRFVKSNEKLPQLKPH